MLIRASLYSLLILCYGHSFAQINRYVVYFKDKTGTPYSLTEPEKFLTAASINRRAKQQINYTSNDLPVSPTYVLKVRALGAKTFYPSRWLNCLLVECTEAVSLSLKQLPEVVLVEYVAPGSKLLGGRISLKINRLLAAKSQSSQVQFQQLGIDEMQEAGFHGEGINIAIFDGGFSGVNTASAFQQAKIKYAYNFIENSKTVYAFDQHGTEVFSILGSQSASFTGGAFAANFFLFVTEDISTEYRIEEYNWLFAAERADSLGVDLISSSLGYSEFTDSSMDYNHLDLNGNTAIVSKAAKIALQKGIMVVNSAGNEGNRKWKYITPPADVKGILAVGSITSQQELSNFSSVGPTADNRIKPDVVALGSSASVIKASGNLSTDSGTSFSCPLISCLVAGVWQAYPNLDVAGIYNAIIRSADQAFTPDNLKGYGLPSFRGVKNYLESTLIEEQITISPNPLTNGIMKVTFKEPKEGDITVLIFDLQGRSLLSSSAKMIWQNNPLEFDLSALATGVYIVRIKTDSASVTSRLVKF